MAAQKMVSIQDVLCDEYLLSTSTSLHSQCDPCSDWEADSPSLPTETVRESERAKATERNEQRGEDDVGEAAGGSDPDTTEVAVIGEQQAFPRQGNSPRGKQQYRPRSCQASTSCLPCVRQAVSHLELLQNITQQWHRRDLEKLGHRHKMVNTSQALQSPVSQTNQLTNKDSRLSIQDLSLQSFESEEPSRTSSEGIIVPTAPPAHTESTVPVTDKDQQPDIPYLGAEDVIEKTISLLARLETDRQETQKKYEKEKETTQMLKKQIHDKCVSRLRRIPEKIQELHEQMEPYFLNARIQIKLAKAREAKKLRNPVIAKHKQLEDDIEFFKRDIPEKLERTRHVVLSMDEMKKKREEMDQKLLATQQIRAQAQKKLRDARAMASRERANHNREIDNLRNKVSKISHELTVAHNTFRIYGQAAEHLRVKLAEAKYEFPTLEEDMAQALSGKQIQEAKMQILNTKMSEASSEYTRMFNDNKQTMQDLQKLRGRPVDPERKLEELKKELRVHVALRQQLQQTVENLDEQLVKIQGSTKVLRKRLPNINREMLRVEELLVFTKREYNHLKVKTDFLRQRRFSLIARNRAIERPLQEHIDALRAEIQGSVNKQCFDKWRMKSLIAQIREMHGSVGEDERSRHVFLKNLFDKNVVQKTQIRELQEKIEHWKTKIRRLENNLQGNLYRMEVYFNQLQDELQRAESTITVFRQEIAKIEENRKLTAQKKYLLARHYKKKPRKTCSSASDSNLVLSEKSPGWRELLEREVLSDTDLFHHTHKVKVDAKRRFGMVRSFVHPLAKHHQKYGELADQLTHMTWETEMMTKRIEVMDAQQDDLKKQHNVVSRDITALTADFEELVTQLSTARKALNRHREGIEAVESKMKTNVENHLDYMTARDEVLRDLTDKTSRQLARNKELAGRYRKLRADSCPMKEKAFAAYDDTVQLEIALRDVRQLHAQQSKMHSAVAHYHKISDLCYHKEMACLEQAPSLGRLPGDLQQAVSRVTEFLRTEKGATQEAGHTREE